MTSVDLALLVLRLAFGLSMVAHGANKVRGGNGIAGTIAWFASIGMRWPSIQARVAASVEILAGMLFAVGLLTPVAAAALTAVMIVAIVTVHRRVGYFIFLPNGGWEYCAAIIATVSAVAVAGPGEASLDHGLDIVVRGWGAAAILAAGVVSGAVHLAVSYRPSATPR